MEKALISKRYSISITAGQMERLTAKRELWKSDMLLLSLSDLPGVFNVTYKGRDYPHINLDLSPAYDSDARWSHIYALINEHANEEG